MIEAEHTKLFVDGTQVGTYPDSNNYGNIKPLGAHIYDGPNATDGLTDDFRVAPYKHTPNIMRHSRHPQTSRR